MTPNQALSAMVVTEEKKRGALRADHSKLLAEVGDLEGRLAAARARLHAIRCDYSRSPTIQAAFELRRDSIARLVDHDLDTDGPLAALLTKLRLPENDLMLRAISEVEKIVTTPRSLVTAGRVVSEFPVDLTIFLGPGGEFLGSLVFEWRAKGTPPRTASDKVCNNTRAGTNVEYAVSTIVNAYAQEHPEAVEAFAGFQIHAGSGWDIGRRSIEIQRAEAVESSKAGL
jgi:hypothetical protein